MKDPTGLGGPAIEQATLVDHVVRAGGKKRFDVKSITRPLIGAMQMVRRLHIGGNIQSEGWEVLNVNPAPFIDHVCNANDLSRFSDNTFGAIYASHVLEHFDYQGELIDTLREWKRVLVQGGKLFISVPDMDILAGLFLDRKLTVEERFFVIQMIFGGHVDKYDYHFVGLNEEFLVGFLRASGYVNIKRVENFHIFNDTSSMLFKGVPISLNMIAEKSFLPRPNGVPG
jgi:predicted SAM-dependent methyltransferase